MGRNKENTLHFYLRNPKDQLSGISVTYYIRGDQRSRFIRKFKIKKEYWSEEEEQPKKITSDMSEEDARNSEKIQQKIKEIKDDFDNCVKYMNSIDELLSHLESTKILSSMNINISISLLPEEVEKIKELDLNGYADLEEYRDIFILQVTTGLSCKDVNDLLNEKYMGEKTEEIKSFLEKYKGKFCDLDSIYSSSLKDLAELANLNRVVDRAGDKKFVYELIDKGSVGPTHSTYKISINNKYNLSTVSIQPDDSEEEIEEEIEEKLPCKRKTRAKSKPICESGVKSQFESLKLKAKLELFADVAPELAEEVYSHPDLEYMDKLKSILAVFAKLVKDMENYEENSKFVEILGKLPKAYGSEVKALIKKLEQKAKDDKKQ
jgi:hypothetical protein